MITKTGNIDKPNIKKPKLLVLQTHPIQYYAPIYRELAKRGVIDVVVIYLTDAGVKAHFDPGFNREVEWDIDLLSGYRYKVLQSGGSLNNRGFWKLHDPLLIKTIEDEQPEWILLYGYASLMNWAAWWYAQKHNIGILYTSDSNARIDFHQSKLHAYIKGMVVSRFFKGISYFLSPSDANREYLLKYGAESTKIIWSPFAIEVVRFRNAIKNTDRPFTFVWAGKLIERKRCIDYLTALSILKEEGLIFKALLVGDGSLFDSLTPLASSLQNSGHLERHGFINQAAMPEILASAEVLVFTGENEPYGLIATEAAACGCALVVADKIGCVGSLGAAQQDINTLVYPTADVSALVNCMRSLVKNGDRLKTMQAASMDISLQHDVQCAAEIIENTILTR
jgi:glycosyltransferase involved in cell wall biosynthesis